MLLYTAKFLSTIVLLLVVRRCNGALTYNFDATCSDQDKTTITNAFNEMLAMANTAYTRTTAARVMSSPPGDRRVVTNTFNSYFGVTPDTGRDFRISNVIGELSGWPFSALRS